MTNTMTRKPITKNYYAPMCADCNATLVKPHQHADKNWYTGSNDPLRGIHVHRQYWHVNLHDWACTCEWAQMHPGRLCAHLKDVMPLVREGKTCADKPRIVSTIGPELFAEPVISYQEQFLLMFAA